METLKLNVKDFPKSHFPFNNDQFPPLDALTYWHFLQKAKKVIEVGCGYSTILPHHKMVQLYAIDPCPRFEYLGVKYIKKPIQAVTIDSFEILEENDILFIDSSHIYEEGSDVKYLIEEVIPTLNKGVLIHFHDFFGIDGYPESWKDIKEMQGWNENAYVLPLLYKYEVLAINHYISKEGNEERKKKYPFVPDNITGNLGAIKGASLWLRK